MDRWIMVESNSIFKLVILLGRKIRMNCMKINFCITNLNLNELYGDELYWVGKYKILRKLKHLKKFVHLKFESIHRATQSFVHCNCSFVFFFRVINWTKWEHIVKKADVVSYIVWILLSQSCTIKKVISRHLYLWLHLENS